MNPMQKKSLLLCSLLIATWPLQAQCFCADMRFRLILPGLKYENRHTNYTIRTLQPGNAFREDLYPSEIKGDTVHFSYPTQGGIDSLVLLIGSPDRKRSMQLSVLHMHFDIDYFIDLTTFTPGHFLFDWAEIGACQQQQREQSLIACGQTMFYQLKLVDKNNPYWPQSFVHHEIRPYQLQMFQTDSTAKAKE
jgi:hypothetical protein